MPCYGCGAGFGTFKKEHGCKNCGMAFCMKCLPNKYPIARLSNEKHRVCIKCYNILTEKTDPDKEKIKYDLPENYKKRVAALEEREAHGHVYHKTDSHPKVKKHPPNMSDKDWDIQQRLEKLREKTPAQKAAGQVSAKEIDDRLARLKGMDPSRYSTTSNTSSQGQKFYHPPERRTQQEQMNDLLDEICDEVELDEKFDPVREIENRLAKLRERDKPGDNTNSNIGKCDPVREIENRLAKLRERPDDNTNSKTESSENNLNKPSLRDSQSFSQNISNTPNNKTHNSENNSAQTRTSSIDGKPTNAEGEDAISAEEINRILSEASNQLEEDAKKALKGLEEDKDIMRKLQEIKRKRKESKSDINKDDEEELSDSENEDQMADNVIKQALEEVKLDEAAAKDGVNIDKLESDTQKNKSNDTKIPTGQDDDEWYDPDELPYCCICTEDAVIRCIDCDRDLYCNKCFSEGHKELGLDDHVSIKYMPPKGRT